MPKQLKLSGRNAPTRPRSSFNLYMQSRLGQSSELLARPFADRSRIIGGEWSSMSIEQKQMYNEQALREREKYKEDLVAYKKTQEYKDWIAKHEGEQNSNDTKGGKRSAKVKIEADADLSDSVSSKVARIPIFTQDFLEYNRQREISLRNLRKQVAKLDEETALLSKHVENLANVGVSLEQQIKSAESSLASEKALVQTFRRELVATFSDLAVPMMKCDGISPVKDVERITPSSVDAYLSLLAAVVSSGQHDGLKAMAAERIKNAIRSNTLTLCSK